MPPRWFFEAALSFSLLTAWCSPASAYRPFEGTDAAVADTGELEVELQLAGFLEQGADKTLVAPAWVVNIGISQGGEAVFQGQGQCPLGSSEERASLSGAAAFLKGVLREGSLQDKPGPSIATEFGLLLPSLGDEPGTGASFAAIVSQRWPSLTVHVNAQAAMTRQQHADLGLSLIVEGPHDWTIRPVAEFFYEREFGGSETGSILVGAIWQVRDNVAFDLGLRGGWIDGQPLREIRAGVTFSFGVFAGHQ